MKYTIIENYWNGWTGVFTSGKFVTLAASAQTAKQFINAREGKTY